MSHREPESYGRLCAEYYDLDKPRAEPVALQFFMERGQASLGPILEPMCGTGSFLLPMLEAGLDVSGFDASPWMLAILQRKARAMQLKPNVWRGFIDELERPDRYGLIFIPNGSMNLLVRPGEVQNALARFYEHLLPGGLLAFDLETEPMQAPGDNPEPWVGWAHRPNGGRKIRLTAVTVPGEAEVETSLSRYEVVNGDHVEDAEAEVFRIRHFKRETMFRWLIEAGFRELQILKSHTNEAAGPDGHSVSVEAVK